MFESFLFKIKPSKVANAIMLASLCAFVFRVAGKYASLIDCPINPSKYIQVVQDGAELTVMEHIPLSSAKPGLTLDRVRSNARYNGGSQAQRVSMPKRAFNLESLNDLRRHVNIRTA